MGWTEFGLPFLIVLYSIFKCSSVVTAHVSWSGRFYMSLESQSKTAGDSPNKNEGLLEFIEDLEGYQSDQPVLPSKFFLLFPPPLFSSYFLSLFIIVGGEVAKQIQLLNPSVLCDRDSMTLNLHGSHIPEFFVETGELVWSLTMFSVILT